MGVHHGHRESEQFVNVMVKNILLVAFGAAIMGMCWLGCSKQHIGYKPTIIADTVIKEVQLPPITIEVGKTPSVASIKPNYDSVRRATEKAILYRVDTSKAGLRAIIDSLWYVLETTNIYDTSINSGKASVRIIEQIRNNERIGMQAIFNPAPTVIKEINKTIIKQNRQVYVGLGIGGSLPEPLGEIHVGLGYKDLRDRFWVANVARNIAGAYPEEKNNYAVSVTRYFKVSLRK